MDERTPLLGGNPSTRLVPTFLNQSTAASSHVGLNVIFLKRLWTLLVLARAYPALALLLISVSEAYVVSQIGTVAGQFYSVFVDGDKTRFASLAVISIVLYLLSSLIFSTKTWLAEYFAWRWRARLTRHVQILYSQASYLYGSKIDVDNPDQRIAQDLPQFCTVLAQVLTSVASAPFGVVWYTWCVVGIFGTWVPVAACWLFFLVGACLQRLAVNSIARLVYQQEQLEGSYRFAHMRLREYQEEIALCRGQQAELQHLQQQLDAALRNQGKLVLRRTALAAVTKFLDYVGCLVNYACIGLAVFAGQWASAADTPGGIAAKVSVSSFYLLTLVYSFTQVLDLASSLGDLAGLTGRVAVLLEALQQVQRARQEQQGQEQQQEQQEGFHQQQAQQGQQACQPLLQCLPQQGQQEGLAVSSCISPGAALAARATAAVTSQGSTARTPSPRRPAAGRVPSPHLPPLSPAGAVRQQLRRAHYYPKQHLLTICSSASSLLEAEQQQGQRGCGQGYDSDSSGEELGEYRRQGSSGMDRYASQAVLLQAPTPMLSAGGSMMEVSLHSLGADLLLRDVAQVFPGAPANATLLAAVTFQPCGNMTQQAQQGQGQQQGQAQGQAQQQGQEQALGSSTEQHSGAAPPPSCGTPTAEAAAAAAGGVGTEAAAAPAASPAQASALDACLASFLQFEGAVRAQLQAQGHWCDAVDPLTGYALHGPRGRKYNEVVGAEVLLGYSTQQEQGFPLTVHPVWGTAVYPATLLTSAPLPLLKAALQAALQPLGLPRGISISSAGAMETVSSVSALRAGAESVLSIQGLTCSTPSGIAIVADLGVDLPCGASLLITGPSGCGKSTLLKCLMGLWPSEGGVVLMPAAKQTMCLPQRALPAPAQQLCSQLTYPDTEACDDAYVQQLLSWSELCALGARQQSNGAWEQHLSPGELQRAAFARVLHHRPVLVLIDEGTSSVTTHMECHLYGLLKQAGIAWVSVGHRETLQGLHTLVLEISGDGSGGWTLRSAKQV